MKCWAGTQQGLRQLCAGLDQVLTVVEDEQGSLRLQEVGDDGEGGAASLLAQTQRCEQALRHKCRVGERGEIDEPHAVGKDIAQAGGNFKSQARLARAARAS